MLYNLRLTVAVFKCGVSPAPHCGGRRLVIFFGLVLQLKLQIELSVKHRSRKVYSAKPQGVRKSDFYSERSISVECLYCYISDCKVTGRFHTKTWIRFISIRTYKKISDFIDYIDKLAQLKSTCTSELQLKNAIRDLE